MDQGQTLLLGLVAGATIMLGLPLGRVRGPSPRLQVLLNAITIGILLFLVWDVLSHAWEPVDAAVGALHDGTAGLEPVIGLALLFMVGNAVGLLGLAGYEHWMTHRREPATGPGAMAAAELETGRLATPARRMALLIAIGIGMHNFGEGLAIGGSAARGELSLATLLVIGFALHNATEGFGIVAPLAAVGERPSWRFLLVMGLIGGGPTFVGTAVGQQFTSDLLSITFLTLAAGSILYVVIQLVGVAVRAGRPWALYGGVLVGLGAGFVTDMVVTAAGA